MRKKHILAEVSDTLTTLVLLFDFCCCQRLVSLVADGIYIHSLHDMKLLHVIPSSLHESTVCVLSPGMPMLGQDAPSYLAYSDLGDMKIFDTVDLVSMLFDIDEYYLYYFSLFIYLV